MPEFKKIRLSGVEFEFRDESKIPFPEQNPNGEYDQILRTNGDGTTRWDNAASQEEIGSAVKNWLEENVTSGETLVVDNSLTISGAAADAKVTGDNVRELKSAIASLINEDEDGLILNKVIWGD